MAAVLRVEIRFGSDVDTTILPDRYIRDNAEGTLERLEDLIASIRGGAQDAAVLVQSCGGTLASTTVTCDYDTAVVDTDDITIGPTTISIVTSPATESEIAVGANDAGLATNLGAAINAHSVLSKLVYASVSGAVVTVYSRLAGIVGNEIALSETGTAFALGAAALAGGTDAAPAEYTKGVLANV